MTTTTSAPTRPQTDSHIPLSRSQRRKTRRNIRAQFVPTRPRRRRRRLLYNSTAQQRKDEEEYGDKISRDKASNTIRIIFQNIDRLPKQANPTLQQTQGRGHYKNHQFCEALRDKQGGIFCFAEHGLNFSLLPADDQRIERSLGQLPPPPPTNLYSDTIQQRTKTTKAPYNGEALVSSPYPKPFPEQETRVKTKQDLEDGYG